MAGDAVRARRLELGLTQEALAQRSGLTLRTVCRIEANDNTPTIDTLRKLAKALDSDLDKFLTEEVA